MFSEQCWCNISNTLTSAWFYMLPIFSWICAHYNAFYENVMSCCFVPKITLPTRICDTASTLIDNIYTNVLDKSHTSGMLIRPLSDHQMYFCVMNENYVKPTAKQKYIEVEVLNEENVESFRKEIVDLEIHNKLDDTVDRDPNYNYEIVSTLLQNESLNIFQSELRSLTNIDIRKKGG